MFCQEVEVSPDLSIQYYKGLFMRQDDDQHSPPTEAQQKHDTSQVQRSLRETLINWLPTDTRTFLFALVIVTDLIIGIVHFAITGDMSTVMTLLGYAAAYVGLTEVRPLFLKGKQKEVNLHR